MQITYTTICSSRQSYVVGRLLHPLHRWGIEKLCNLSKVTRLVNRKARILAEIAWLWIPCALSWVCFVIPFDIIAEIASFTFLQLDKTLCTESFNSVHLRWMIIINAIKWCLFCWFDIINGDFLISARILEYQLIYFPEVKIRFCLW